MTNQEKRVSIPLNPLQNGDAPGSRAWIGTLMEMQEEERRRISQELHDDLGQRLALLEIQIDQLGRECGTPKIVKGLQRVRERIGEMDRDLHRICYRLHPVVLEKLGLSFALESLCREFSEKSGICTDFIQRGLPKRVAKQLSLCAYRLVQEALHNVAKHANALEAKVTVNATASGLEVAVEDSGCGFDRRVVRTHGGLGLVSIEERVRSAGGRCFIRSRPGAGTKVSALLPMRPEVLAGPARHGRALD
jgi:signal transduction histidine kinase